ncbi:MAG: flavodoxin family protein [Syntrophomonadaceae bacterium]|nr:flavodoxin family protein [Syntrophomonadaceae bacterium]
MLIIGLNGSPNKEGNTAYLLKEALSEVRSLGADTELIHCTQVLKGLKHPFCLSCSSPCSAKCYEGTVLEKVFEQFSRCAGIILGSPVYFGTVSGQMKAFWDKSRAVRHKKTLLNVVGGALAVGGARFGGQETTLRALQDIMLVHGMIVIGDGYMDDDCGHQGVAAQRPSELDDNARQRAQILARRMVQVCKATQSIRNLP